MEHVTATIDQVSLVEGGTNRYTNAEQTQRTIGSDVVVPKPQKQSSIKVMKNLSKPITPLKENERVTDSMLDSYLAK